MSKVTRWSRGFDGGMTKDPFGDWVLAGDAAHRETTVLMKLATAQSELAALREELAKVELKLSQSDFNYDSSILEMQQRLEAAEQRNAEAISLLHDASIQLAGWVKPTEFPRAGIIEFLSRPTESGASE